MATKITTVFLILIALFDYKNLFSFKTFLKYFYPIIIFFSLLTIRGYIDQTAYYSGYFELVIFLPILVFFILSNHSKTDTNVLLKGLFVFSITVALTSILAVIGVRVDVYGQGRFSVFGDNTNEIGLRLCISLLVFIAIIFENKLKLRQWRYSLFIFFPTMIKYLIDTGSRVAILSLAAGILFYILLFNYKFSAKKTIILLVSFFVMILVWNLFLQYTLLGERLLDTAEKGDISSREVIWENVYYIFLPNLFFGIGLPRYQYEVTAAFGYYTSPHNVFIEVIVYTGIVGLAIFVIFLFRVIKNAVNKYFNKVEILPIILLIPLVGMLFSGQLFGVKIGWILFAYFISPSFTKSANDSEKQMKLINKKS